MDVIAISDGYYPVRQSLNVTPSHLVKNGLRELCGRSGDDWVTGKETWEKKQGDCEELESCELTGRPATDMLQVPETCLFGRNGANE